MADSMPSELDQLRRENARLIGLLEAHSQGDHQALLAALDEETTPTPALLEAWQLHQNQVVRS